MERKSKGVNVVGLSLEVLWSISGPFFLFDRWAMIHTCEKFLAFMIHREGDDCVS